MAITKELLLLEWVKPAACQTNPIVDLVVARLYDTSCDCVTHKMHGKTISAYTTLSLDAFAGLMVAITRP
jgi:hypothetical protein